MGDERSGMRVIRELWSHILVDFALLLSQTALLSMY